LISGNHNANSSGGNANSGGDNVNGSGDLVFPKSMGGDSHSLRLQNTGWPNGVNGVHTGMATLYGIAWHFHQCLCFEESVPSDPGQFLKDVSLVIVDTSSDWNTKSEIPQYHYWSP
jgi:hypothetical protein